jgi:hypothetical protein
MLMGFDQIKAQIPAIAKDTNIVIIVIPPHY